MGLTFQIRHLIGKYIDFMKCLKSHKGDRSMAFQEIKGSYMNFAKKTSVYFLEHYMNGKKRKLLALTLLLAYSFLQSRHI
jgi:hypothetical protein